MKFRDKHVGCIGEGCPICPRLEQWEREGRYQAVANLTAPAGHRLRNDPPPSLDDGPGAELIAIMRTLDAPECDRCKEYARQMNQWGVAGCAERRNEIVGHLEDERRQLSWLDLMVAAGRAIKHGLPFTLGGLVDEAIARAEEKEAQKKSEPAGRAPTLLPEALTVRNLLYHLYPVAGNGAWQWNVEQLMRRMDLFNGKRVVGVVTDGRTSPVEQVKAAFRGSISQFVVLPNDRSLREVKTFEPLFGAVESRDPSEATFYGHGKGIRHGLAHTRGTTATLWAEMMYEACLGYWPEVERLLQQYPCAGAFKKVGCGFNGSRSGWHYSGSFFWFRNADLFSRNWRHIDRQWFGIEPYLSLHYGVAQAGCIFKEGIVGVVNDGNRERAMRANHLDMYDWKFCNLVKDEWEAWKRQHQHSCRTAASTA